MKEIITWQASVKVNGVWHTTDPMPELSQVTKLVEKMVAKLGYRFCTVTYVRNVAFVTEETVEAK